MQLNTLYFTFNDPTDNHRWVDVGVKKLADLRQDECILQFPLQDFIPMHASEILLFIHACACTGYQETPAECQFKIWTKDGTSTYSKYIHLYGWSKNAISENIWLPVGDGIVYFQSSRVMAAHNVQVLGSISLIGYKVSGIRARFYQV